MIRNTPRMAELQDKIAELTRQTNELNKELDAEIIAEYVRETGIGIGTVVLYRNKPVQVAQIVARSYSTFSSVDLIARRRKKDGTFGDAVAHIYSTDGLKKYEMVEESQPEITK